MTTSSATTTSIPSGSFAKTSGTLFNIDGNTGYFAGTNSYWIGFLPNNADVDLVMSHLQTSGLKVLRVWGFNDVNNMPGTGTVWYQSLSGSTPTINTGANGLQRLDYVVKSAEAHGIKLIINFVNNWDDYGGIKAYTNYYGGSHTTWYTNTAAQAQYRTYIKAVVSRYITSTAVFAWELANEPRCSGCNTDVIYKWAADTSAYIKSLDPNHMVALGDEGFNPSAGDGSYPYQTSEGVSFVKNLGISTLDFGVYHMYASAWGVSESTFPAGWIQSHAAACVAAKKPCLFEEYGTTNSHSIEANWQSTTLNAAGNGADLFWQHGDSLSSGQSPNDGYTIYYGTSEWNTLVTQHVQSIRVKYP
ncbi:glycoside hydrolase superfamily [Diaporthe sp. PMI_573]|nr:glycoside hydrolase superfamily [Diaporthaceae sp. PMI_573]